MMARFGSIRSASVARSSTARKAPSASFSKGRNPQAPAIRRARIGKAVHDREILLGEPEHGTDADLLRRPGEMQAPAAAAQRLDEAAAAQPLRHLRQMVGGDAVGRRDLLDRGALAATQAEIHQHAQRVVAMERQVHDKSGIWIAY